MKTIKFLSMAALVVMGTILASCEKIEQDVVEPIEKDNIIVCTTSINLGSSLTKALTADGTKTFAAGDKIAVIYKNASGQTVKAVSEAISSGVGTGSATFTVTLTNPDNTKAIRYIYPAAMAKGTVATDAAIDDAGTVDFTKLNSQDGKLATLGSELDICTYDAASWSSGTLPTGTLDNKLAILAITLKNSGGSSDITSTITGMTIGDGTNSYTVNRSASAGPIYVAILPVDNKDITITATRGLTTKYTKSLTGKTYEAGNGYNVAWRMLTLLDLTNPSFGQVIGNNGKNYAYANLPSGVTAVAMIAYINGDHGLAIAMADENSSKSIHWTPAMNAAAAHEPKFSNGTWKIPTQDEWIQMFRPKPGYANTYLYDTLNSSISIAQGTPLKKPETYWTSTDGGNNTAYTIGLSEDGKSVSSYTSRSGKEVGGICARSCLAF